MKEQTMTTATNTTKAPTTAPKTTVAVIGCGPGGMFFCHAVESRRRDLLASGGSLDSLPKVTCFEQASGPGGVWRAKRSFGEEQPVKVDDGRSDVSSEESSGDDPAKDTSTTVKVANDKTGRGQVEETTNMYEALWTNGPKENIELPNYAFDEHFGGPLPVYLPRHALLEYMVSRVTKHAPTFFQDYVKFNTSVNFVKYDKTKKKFIVTTQDLLTKQTTVGEYDKCIWAGGENGKPNMPASLLRTFHEGGFRGRVIHSSDTSKFAADVKGKRVLMIGGSFSAEDLALTAIKEGAETVYISSRSDDPPITWTGAWPEDKVKLLLGKLPVKVTENGDCIQFASCTWRHPNNYKIGTHIKKSIRGIDTVIVCTGYASNMDMLDDELKAAFQNRMDRKLEVPPGWKMKPNAMSEVLGDVEPGDVRWGHTIVRYPDMYRGVLISNPSMMFVHMEIFSNPIFATDVSAWSLLAYITKDLELPSEEEMRERNVNDALAEMHLIEQRYAMDSAYCAAWDSTVEDSDEAEEILVESGWEWERTLVRVLARTMQESKYPTPITFGSYDNLSEAAEKIVTYGRLSVRHRQDLKLCTEEEKSWRTFRDYKDASRFYSTYTKTAAVPLGGRWLDIDTNDSSIAPAASKRREEKKRDGHVEQRGPQDDITSSPVAWRAVH